DWNYIDWNYKDYEYYLKVQDVLFGVTTMKRASSGFKLGGFKLENLFQKPIRPNGWLPYPPPTLFILAARECLQPRWQVYSLQLSIIIRTGNSSTTYSS